MKKFVLFMLGLVALFILLANIGPMVLLAASVWLLYVIFKQFVKADSVGKKIGWLILGMFVLSITFSNIFAVIGLVAVYGLYIIYKEWKQESKKEVGIDEKDPFINFEKEWADLTK